jgi:hypothetical protein
MRDAGTTVICRLGGHEVEKLVIRWHSVRVQPRVLASKLV